jgi:hypothetical protein
VRAAIRKHGPKSFTFKLLCCGTQEYIADLEVRAIEHFKTREPDFGYNMAPGGKISPMADPEIAARVAATQRGRTITEEHRAKLIAAQANRPPVTPETREKISKGVRARPLSIYSRGQNHYNYGRPLPCDPKVVAAAVSAAHKGKPRRPESVAKGRASLMGHPVSAETRAKISEAKKGKSNGPHSVETKVKIAAAMMGNRNRASAQNSDVAN